MFDVTTISCNTGDTLIFVVNTNQWSSDDVISVFQDIGTCIPNIHIKVIPDNMISDIIHIDRNQNFKSIEISSEPISCYTDEELDCGWRGLE